VPDLAGVAAELYALAPEDFVASRDQRVKAARGEGDRALAAAISKLPKPTTVAWLLNLLVRDRPDQVRELIALGDALREAQQSLSGPQLRQLSRRRHDVIEAFTGMAVGPAQETGRPVTATLTTQVRETLTAAIADPEAGEALLSGRLTKGLSYVGLGDVGGDASHEPRPAAAAGGGARKKADKQRARVEAARAEVQRLEHAVSRAEDEQSAAHRREQEARGERADRAGRVDELRADLAAAEAALVDADGEMEQASAAQRSAEACAADARAALEQARAVLAEQADP